MAKKKQEGTNMTDDIRRRLGAALKEATNEVINDLIEVGPGWSGEFMESWYVEKNGKRYASLGNLTMNVKDIRKGRPSLYIGNSAPHATQAMDLEPFNPEEELTRFTPVNPVVDEGTRPEGGLRGEVFGTGQNKITAETDWFDTYMNGGGFDRSFAKGAEAGFLRVGPGR